MEVGKYRICSVGSWAGDPGELMFSRLSAIEPEEVNLADNM